MKDRIKLIMEQTGLSQQDFAAKLSISPASLSSIFTGRTNPTNNHVMAIHRAFPDINVNWLMFGEGDMRSSSDALSTNPDGLFSEDDSVLPSSSATPAAPSPTSSPSMLSMFSVDASAPTATQHPSPIATAPASHQRAARSQQEQRATAFPHNANIIDKPARKIKEIRVFYDDGTYEAFVPSSK